MALQERPTKIIKNLNYDSIIETSKSVPAELILEILLRLPVESLLRCKSVCKLWFSLISDPHFVNSHLKLSIANNDYTHHHQLFWISMWSLKSCPINDLLLDNSVMNAVDHDYPLNPRSNRHDIMIVGSCNGLVCIVANRVTPYICNPSTRMWNRLPSSGFKNQLVVYGFGYEDLTGDYKVVGLSVGRKRQTKLFSLKSGKWKNIDVDTQLRCFDHGVFSNGSIHWIVRDSKSSCDVVIVSFDLAKETYGQLAPPVYDDDDDDDDVSFRLGVLGDSLCVIYEYYDSYVDVWVMKVYGVKDSWTKLVSISYPTAQSTLDHHISMPLFISNDGKLLFKSDGYELVVYDSKNKSFSEIQNFGSCHKVCNFVESLVSLNTAT